MNYERLEYLLLQKQSGAITLAEQMELSELVKQEESFAFVSDAMDEVFNSHLKYNIDNQSVNEALNKVHKRIQGTAGIINVRKGNIIRRLLPAVAACLVMIVAIGFFLSKTIQKKDAGIAANNIVTTQKGSKTNLVLPDGTKVWLNADSRLTYEKDYGNTVRKVILTGEAYFDVVENKEIPFVVHTNAMEVKVLGTAFNVRAYEGEVSAEATLIRGSIEVLLATKNKIVLKPNEKIIVQNKLNTPDKVNTIAKTPVIEVVNIDLNAKDSTSVETGWTRNRLVFEDEQLEKIIPVLERWYNVSIQLQKPVNSRLYNGTFENDKLEDVLASLKAIGGFRYKMEKDKVIIY